MPIRLTDIKEEGIRLTNIPEKSQGIRLTDIPEITSKGIRLTDIITKEDTPFSKMSKFGKVLDIIGRPVYGLKAMVAQAQRENLEAMKGIPETDLIARSKVLLDKKPQIKKRFEAFWRGLSGQERHTINELAENVGIRNIPFMGFAAEVTLDPLMYGGYQAVTKGIGKAVGLTTKGIKKIPGVVKVGTFIAEKVQPVTSTLKTMFITKTGIGNLGELIDKYLSKREWLKYKELKFGIKARNVIQNISKKTGHSIDDVEKQIVNLIEQPQIIPRNVPQESIALANIFKSHLTNILTTELHAGVPITSLAGGVRNIMYFPRITTKEAMRLLNQAKQTNFGGNAKIWYPKLKNAIRRKTRDFTLGEWNDLCAQYGVSSLGGKTVENFFLQKPSIAVAIRGIRSAKAVTSAQFLDDVGKTFGLKTAPSFWEELPGTITKLNPSLKNLRFDPEIASEITRITPKYFNPNETGIFLKGWSVVQNLWKKWTLAPFAKYHLRNMVGNLWNVHLEGSARPRHFAMMQTLQTYRKYKGTGGIQERFALAELRKFKILPQQADDLILRMEQTQTLGHGWYAADIETSIVEQFERGFLRLPLKKKIAKVATGRIVTEKGMALGTTIENNARGALFLARLEKGDDALRASLVVKKYLFDYQNLTAFEKQVMKRAFPFYTWTRKNIPLQLENIWKQPQKFARLAPVLRERSPQDLLRLKYAMPQLYERLPIELKRTVDTVTYVPLEGLLPAGDLAKIVRPQEIFQELLSPFVRAPLELAFNKSLYFESEIQRYDKQTQELLKKDIPIRWKYLLTTILPQARLVNEINKLIKKQIRKEKLTPDEQLFHHTLSTVYKINLKDLRRRALQVIERKMQDLEKGGFWAKKYERLRELERVKQTIQEYRQLRKTLR